MNSAGDQQRSRRGIISAGSWTVDRIKIVDLWPQQEHLARIIDTDKQGGGSGHNLGVDIRKLDDRIPVEAIGLISNDADGDFLIDIATKAGIDTTQLRQNGKAETSFTEVISVAETGKRTFFHYPGTNDQLSPDDFDFSQCHGRILHLGLLGVHATMDTAWQQEPNGWVAVLKAAQQSGIQTNLELVSVEAGKIREIALPCIPWLNTLIVNEYELGAVAGVDLCQADGSLDLARFKQAAETLFKINAQQNGAMQLVVVHSPQMAMAMSADGSITSHNSFKVPAEEIVSSVGAGDAFAAGMLYGVHEDWTISASLELAHAAAAASLRSPTTVGSMESVDSVLHFAHKQASQ